MQKLIILLSILVFISCGRQRLSYSTDRSHIGFRGGVGKLSVIDNGSKLPQNGKCIVPEVSPMPVTNRITNVIKNSVAGAEKFAQDKVPHQQKVLMKMAEKKLPALVRKNITTIRKIFYDKLKSNGNGKYTWFGLGALFGIISLIGLGLAIVDYLLYLLFVWLGVNSIANYDFHRLMDNATLLKCSEFGDEIIARM